MNDIQYIPYGDSKLLCNFENGAVVLVDDDHAEQVQVFADQTPQQRKESPTETMLAELGFFEIEENRKQAYVHVTHRCNMDCIGCYSAVSNRNTKQDLSFEQIKAIFDQLKERSYTDIVLSGGEPMIRRDIEQIVEYSHGLGFSTVMITNGSLDVSDRLLKSLDAIAISIDDLEKEENQLNRKVNKGRVLDIKRRAEKIGTSVSGIITINSTNIDNIEDYYALNQEYQLPISFSLFYSGDERSREYLIDDEKLRHFTYRSFMEFPQLLEGFSPLGEIYCRRNCGAGDKSISVSASGELAPCHMMHDRPFGNILEDEAGAWNAAAIFKENVNKEKSECSGCRHEALCGRGCLARSNAIGGTHRKDPYCTLYETYYDRQYELVFG
ncbi:MAG: radical SAM protein [Tissierellia bacterium]|nr:radical SAM protein [Tissierellia bacterium]